MNPGNILVADDDSAIRTVLSQALSRAGYDVRTTGTAATLYERHRYRWPSVAVLMGDVEATIQVLDLYEEGLALRRVDRAPSYWPGSRTAHRRSYYALPIVRGSNML
jgi:CheY-like chemotaxis protein